MSVSEINQHIADLFHEERDTPFKEIHLSWQVERVRDIFILLNVHFIVFDQNNSALVMILTTIVWSTENCDDRWESLVASPTVHFVAIDLYLMSANDRDEIICAQNLFDWF